MKAYAEVNGRKVAYGDIGGGDPLLVLGDPGRAGDLGLLADWFRILTPEWRRPDDLAAFAEALDLWPLRLLGWGEGAAAALALAMTRPDLVCRLAVVGPLAACDGPAGRERLAGLATMTAPLLVLQGDDAALDVAHSAALTRTAPDGRLAVLPAPSYRLPAAKADAAGLILLDFFEGEPR